jgi:hypothetical protein
MIHGWSAYPSQRAQTLTSFSKVMVPFCKAEAQKIFAAAGAEERGTGD